VLIVWVKLAVIKPVVCGLFADEMFEEKYFFSGALDGL